MKRTAAIVTLCTLFATAFADGKGGDVSPWPDSLRSVDLYTEGIKFNAIHLDTTRAREAFLEAIRRDSSYAPAYYELASIGLYADPDAGVLLARRAHELDTTNHWYHRLYGQSLLLASRYAEALRVYRDLTDRYPKDPDNYRLLAALYEQQAQPYSAIATLDSAELHFGRIPLLSDMKRRLLIGTRQFDRALEEARIRADEAPYEADEHTALADIYGAMGQDSAAKAEYCRALDIDSTNMGTLMSLADFYNARQDYRSQIATVKRMFLLDDMPLDEKIRRYEQYTANIQFYREHFFQISDLASALILRYPDDKRVVEIYARHLIFSGELEKALEFYKRHTNDTPPQADYFRSIIDIENYLQRPDSADRYIGRALKLFPADIDFRLAEGNRRFMQGSKENSDASYRAAIGCYEQALRYARTDSVRSIVWGMIGDTWHQRIECLVRASGGKASPKPAARYTKECYRAYEKSLGYDPDNASVLNNYAYYLSVENRDLERALAMSTQAVALSESNPTYLDTQAWILYRMERFAEARKIQQQAIALDGRKSTELLVHYGDILSALGERFMAESYWRMALEKGYEAEAIDRRMRRQTQTAEK